MEDTPRKRARWKRWLLWALLVLVVLALAFLVMLLVFEYRPDQFMDTPVHGGGEVSGEVPGALELVSWNIGYAGLGKDADFFMDGGEMVRPPDEGVVRGNLQAVCDYIEKNPADLMLLQEVDLDASRTFGIDQVSAIAKVLPGHYYARAINFKVPWIPYPLLRPIGRVNSGLLSFSRFKPGKAVRHQLPGDYPWPVRVFHLKRCLHELRFPAADGKDWVVLHLHLSAFDAGGHLRKQQMAYLRELIIQLQKEGQHVIAGGDWNQAFPGVGDHHFPHQANIPDWFQKAPVDWAPEGWKWVFDPQVPSLRATNKPYVPGENFVTSVDGFLVSPEIEVHKVECADLGFVHTDHQPVRLRLSLKVAE